MNINIKQDGEHYILLNEYIQIYHVWKGYLRKIPVEPKGEGNLVSRLVFFANIPPKHDISV